MIWKVPSRLWLRRQKRTKNHSGKRIELRNWGQSASKLQLKSAMSNSSKRYDVYRHCAPLLLWFFIFFLCFGSMYCELFYFFLLLGDRKLKWPKHRQRGSQGEGKESKWLMRRTFSLLMLSCWKGLFLFWASLWLTWAETDETQWTLIFHVLFFSQVADLTSRLQKEKDELAAANSALLQQTEQLTAENTDLSISNEALKV